MCVRANQDPEQPPNGHAMMMTCPPPSHVEKHPDAPYPHQMPAVPNSDLMRLLSLSKDLPLEGEITPVIALHKIRSHPRFSELTLADFEAIKGELQTKTRCYGWVVSPCRSFPQLTQHADSGRYWKTSSCAMRLKPSSPPSPTSMAAICEMSANLRRSAAGKC